MMIDDNTVLIAYRGLAEQEFEKEAPDDAAIFVNFIRAGTMLEIRYDMYGPEHSRERPEIFSNAITVNLLEHKDEMVLLLVADNAAALGKLAKTTRKYILQERFRPGYTGIAK